MKNILLVSALCVGFLLPASAQETWSLEKCVNYARKNSLLVKQNDISIGNAEISVDNSKMARYPNVNSNFSYGLNFGRTIDPTTNSFATQSTQFTSLGVNSGVIIYNGGRLNNTIKQSNLNLKAAKYDKEQAERDIALNVSQAYLNILLAEEQLTSAKGNLKQTEEQLEQTDKLIAAGTLPRNNRLDFVAQIARNEQTIVAAQNGVDLAYLALKQLMMMDLSKEIKVQKPVNLKVPNYQLENLSMEEIYQASVNRQPNVKAGELRVKSAELTEEIAKSGKLPVISAGVNVNTNYSSLGQSLVGTETSVFSQPFSLDFQGQQVDGTLDFEQSVPIFEESPYLDQWWDNLGFGASVNVSYPIWDRRQTKNNMQSARLQKESVILQNEQVKQQLKSDISNAIANAKAGKKSYEAAQRSVDALTLSLDNIEKRLKAGAATNFEFTTASNNLAIAEIELIRSKYDYIFRLMILDFYQGKDIQL